MADELSPGVIRQERILTTHESRVTYHKDCRWHGCAWKTRGASGVVQDPVIPEKPALECFNRGAETHTAAPSFGATPSDLSGYAHRGKKKPAGVAGGLDVAGSNCGALGPNHVECAPRSHPHAQLCRKPSLSADEKATPTLFIS